MAKQQQQQQQRRPAQPTQPQTSTAAKRPAPAPARRTEKKLNLFSTGSNELIFGKENYLWIGAGLVLVLVGLATMVGGAMPSPDVWDESLIYSFRRITLAPMIMLAGFVAVLVGIFRKDKNLKTSAAEPVADALDA